MEVSPLIGNAYTRNSNMGSKFTPRPTARSGVNLTFFPLSFLLTTNRKSPVCFQNMGSDLKLAPPSGEIGMTSFPVIEKRPITPKPLQIGVSLLLTSNRKSLLWAFRI